jgi:hypothetical protein
VSERDPASIQDEEALLVACRPRLSSAAQDRLERRLLGRPPTAVRPRWRLAVAATAGLAALFLGLAVIGGDPFTSGSNETSATSGCRYVPERVPIRGLSPQDLAAGRVVGQPGRAVRLVRRCP